MLTIMMPDGKDKRKRQKRMAALYLVSGLIITVTVFLAYDSSLWMFAVALECWWLWAVWTQDWES